MLSKFVKTYSPPKDTNYTYTTMVRHRGTVIAFASDKNRRIWYTVLDLSNTEITSPLDVNYWLSEPRELLFPDELIRIGHEAAGLLLVPEEKDGEKRNEFRSSTARLTAGAPFQVLSDGQYVYLFRQTPAPADTGNPLLDEQGNAVPITGNTLLVDRFVSIGTELKLKTEVRFQRSRRKDRPLSAKDSLSSTDMEGRPFFEPTGELTMIRSLTGGRFSALLIPTAVPSVERWQLFAYNDGIKGIDSFSIERSPNGLFNLEGTVYYTSPDPQYQDAVFETRPGTCPFTGRDLIPMTSVPIGESPGILRSTFTFKDRSITGGLSALLYYQQEQTVTGYSSEAKPLKTSGRVLLTVATNSSSQASTDGNLIAALDLGVSRFGHLTQLQQSIDLTRIDPPAQPDAVNELVAQIADLDTRVTRLQALRNVSSRIETLNNDISDLEHQQIALSREITSLDEQIAEVDVLIREQCRPLPPSGLSGSTSQTQQQTPSPVVYPPSETCAKLYELRKTLQRQRFYKEAELNSINSHLQVKQAELQAAQGEKQTIEAALNNMNPPQAYPPQADELPVLVAKLEEKRAQLERMTPAMPVVNLDSTGLIAYGALLGFAPTEGKPLLFDSVNGDLILYVRGLNNGFVAGYYDTQTGRALYRLPLDRNGYVYFSARHCGPDMDNTTIRIEKCMENNNELPEFCRLTLINEKLDVTEVWDRMPRNVQQFVNVLNGRAPDSAADPGYYDYDAHATVNRRGWSLAHGSLLFMLYSQELDGNVVNTSPGQPVNAGLTSPVLGCRWLARTPGTTLAFDGNDCVKMQDPGKAEALAVDADFTIEAWVKPGSAGADDRLVQHVSPKSDYTLALQGLYSVSTAVTLGNNDVVLIDPPLELGEEWTIEAWFVSPLPRNAYWNKLTSGLERDSQVLAYIEQTASRYFIDYIEGGGGGANVPSPSQLTYRKFGTYVGDVHQDLGGLGLTDGWHHIAAVGKEGQTHFYLDGIYKGSTSAQSTSDIYAIGNDIKEAQSFGTIDEVRVWSRARSEAEIKSLKDKRASGKEDGMLACWRFFGRTAVDFSGNGRHGRMIGQPTKAASPPALGQVAGYNIAAGTGTTFEASMETLPVGAWTHVAAAYCQSYALKFDGNDYLDCGNQADLDIKGDLTIEAFSRVADLSRNRGVLSKGIVGGPGSQNTPYSLHVRTDGRLVFAFEDSRKRVWEFTSNNALKVNTFYKIGVTRKTVTRDIVLRYDQIQFIIDDCVSPPKRELHERIHRTAGSSNESLWIGKSYSNGVPAFFSGEISEVRIWNIARDEDSATSDISGNEEGLVSWWRFEDREGLEAKDSARQNHAKCFGATWCKTPDPTASHFQLFANGETCTTYCREPLIAGQACTLGQGFKGQMDELRIWKTRRTQEQIQDNMFQRLLGEKEDLIAYYQFDAATGDVVPDHSGRGLKLVLGGGAADLKPKWALSTAPIGYDTPQVRSALAGIETDFNKEIHLTGVPGVQEYGDMQYDAEGELTGSMKRCYSLIQDNQWQLITGYKVGDLFLEWVGQAQSKPQLVGYVEGAPPVPSENLTQNPKGYANAASIELVLADSVTRSYTHARNQGVDASIVFKAEAGIKKKISAGTPFVQADIMKWKSTVGLKVSFEGSYSWLDETIISHGTNVTHLAASALAGAWESEKGVFYCGRRYVPKNEGLALVLSGTYDILALRLKHNNVLVAYQMLPNPDIPRDWNIISFPLNPLYAKQGTLDGKIGYQENGSVQWDEDYNRNLAAYGEYSYFKPKEAYELKKKIDRQEQELTNYYNNLQPSGLSAFQEESLGHSKRNIANTYVWTAAGGFFAESTETMATRQQMSGGSSDIKTMAGLVYSNNVTLMGIHLGIELQALFGYHLKLTETTRTDSKTSYSLKLNLDVERNLQKVEAGVPVFDADTGDPVPCEGKVDAYRFMTFFLQPSVDHFEEFVNKVVDPEWLWNNTDDPNAAALREAIAAQKEAKEEEKSMPWRVLHRVTYVSRVLPEVARAAATRAFALKEAGFKSEYDLVKVMEPVLAGKKDEPDKLAAAVRTELSRRVPNLPESTRESVMRNACAYFGVYDEKLFAPLPKPVVEEAPKPGCQISQIAFIDNASKKRLGAAAIADAEALLKACETRSGRAALARKTGIRAEQLLEWADRLDLMRIDGVSQEYADMLENIGVDTVVELSHRNPDHLSEKIGSYFKSHKQLTPVSPVEIHQWVETAKHTARRLTY